MQNATVEGLVMDLGMSEGNDTAYYLSKGFKVIGVEADTGMCEQLRARFAGEIAAGTLTVLNNAVGSTYGDTVEIHAHSKIQYISGVSKRPDVPDEYVTYRVQTIDWRTLSAQAGIPRYLKVDVEGSEEPFLQSMLTQSEPGRLPEFMSVECYRLDLVEQLHRLGYRRFAMVDQNPPGGLRLAERQIEGRALASADFSHCSGPFGLDVFMEKGWTDIDGIRRDWTGLAQTLHRTWYDCHAWLPN